MKRFKFSIRMMLVLVSLVAVACWFAKEGIQQKLLVERIIAQGGRAYGDNKVRFSSGDSIVHHSRCPLRSIYLTCSSEHPVDEQLGLLNGNYKLKVLQIQSSSANDSALTDSAAKALLGKKISLQYLIVEGATCSNATMRELRDRMPNTKGYLKRHGRLKMTLSSKGLTRILDDMLFRPGWDEPRRSVAASK